SNRRSLPARVSRVCLPAHLHVVVFSQREGCLLIAPSRLRTKTHPQKRGKTHGEKGSLGILRLSEDLYPLAYSFFFPTHIDLGCCSPTRYSLPGWLECARPRVRTCHPRTIKCHPERSEGSASLNPAQAGRLCRV